MFVTIICPITANSERENATVHTLLPLLMASYRSQTGHPVNEMELLVLDSGDEDNSDIMSDLGGDDGGVRYFHDPQDKGHGAMCNRLVKMANPLTNFFMYFNPRDLQQRVRVAHTVARMVSNGAQVAGQSELYILTRDRRIYHSSCFGRHQVSLQQLAFSRQYATRNFFGERGQGQAEFLQSNAPFVTLDSFKVNLGLIPEQDDEVDADTGFFHVLEHAKLTRLEIRSIMYPRLSSLVVDWISQFYFLPPRPCVICRQVH